MMKTNRRIEFVRLLALGQWKRSVWEKLRDEEWLRGKCRRCLRENLSEISRKVHARQTVEADLERGSVSSLTLIRA